MNQPRSASALGKEFPYTLVTMCYIEVGEDGTLTWGSDRGSYERALGRSTAGSQIITLRTRAKAT